jgi:hypothetical protein
MRVGEYGCRSTRFDPRLLLRHWMVAAQTFCSQGTIPVRAERKASKVQEFSHKQTTVWSAQMSVYAAWR